MKKIGKRIFAWMMAGVLLFSGCQRQNKTTVSERTFLRMDTVISVRLYGGTDPQAMLDACGTLLTDLENMLSLTIEGSDISRWNASADGRDVEMTPETVALIERALTLGRACTGAFDVTVAPLGEVWRRAENRGSLPTQEELNEALRFVGIEHLTLENGKVCKDAQKVSIDLGGIGKGYAIDRVKALLSAGDASGGLINFGSNIAVFGSKPDGTPFRISLRDPNDPQGIVGTLRLEEAQVLSVSGDYERYYEIDGARYGHILHPATGMPPENAGLRSVAVVAADGVSADALSTALMVLGEEAGRRLADETGLDFSAVFIYNDRISVMGNIMSE